MARSGYGLTFRVEREALWLVTVEYDQLRKLRVRIAPLASTTDLDPLNFFPPMLDARSGGIH